MQGDFATFVDSLYGTTTTKLEPTEILAPSSLESKKPSVNWILYIVLLSVGILVLFVLLRYFQKHVEPIIQFEEVHKPVEAVAVPKVNPILQQMQPLYENTASSEPFVPVEPETFPIEGPIPVSDDSDQEEHSKLSGDGSDIQEYLRRREAVTKSLEKPTN